MPLPPTDTEYLQTRARPHQVQADGGMTCIVFPAWPLPSGYVPAAADLLVRLPAGYPDLPPDMWWFSPAVRLASGRGIQAADVTEQHLGRPWQRWSRHFQPGQWQSGLDGLENFMALVRGELTRSAA